LYDWAKYTQSKGAIKLHSLLDFNDCLPSYVHITEGNVADITVAKGLRIPSDSVVVADRGYIDFELLNRWHEESVQFVVRLKDSISHIDYGEYPLPDGKDEHILIDEKILLAEPQTRAKYPRKLRRVVVYDSKNNTTIELITNNLTWTASTIAELYKQRWMIEIFFKEIKNHLKIKTFVGTSKNAVMIQSVN
jgi:IS4 transposase